MQRDEVLTTLAQHRAALKTLGVLSLSIFGSVARDEASPESDVDIVVEWEPPITFDRDMEVKFYLEDQLGKKGSPDRASPLVCQPALQVGAIGKVQQRFS